MIHNDAELQAMQERIRLFENILVEARKTYSPVNYQAMSEGVWQRLKGCRQRFALI